MKKICLAISLFCMLTLCGCSEDNPYKQAWGEGVAKGESMMQESLKEHEALVSAKGRYFEIVADDVIYGISYYRDIRTDVMYVVYSTSSTYGRGAGISVMFGPDGLPLTYENWLEMEVP